jgi:hypothetical protein
MARIRFIMASLGATLLTTGAAASVTTLAVSASAAPAPVTAHVWVTTPDGTDKLTPMAPSTRPAARTRAAAPPAPPSSRSAPATP